MNSFGFSLLELLIVIAISAILASIGVSSWRDIQLRSELSGTTFELIAFLNEVKVNANIHNINHFVYLLQNGASNWCLAVTLKNKPTDCQTKFQFISTNNIEISGLTTQSTLIFYGQRSMAQATTIRLKNSIGESRIIVSNKGRVRYCSYNTYLTSVSFKEKKKGTIHLNTDQIE
ncbi:prepilin-type N-terminal cleavage/methylation domain-containing protein [Orbus mooreae]|uniref:prepilin-type N-terminal cleavage/methylation domain-containing protein n=1 Tax=Orbus mooreae TaxID=3074107 RepID=UPI00370D5AF9